MNTSKTIPVSLESRNSLTKMRCADLETGKNSVSPWIIDRRKRSMMFIWSSSIGLHQKGK